MPVIKTKAFLRIILLLLLVYLLCFVLTPLSIQEEVNASGDINGDGVQEEYCLKNHQLTVTVGTTEIWVSPKEYRIDSFSLGDVDNDGSTNLVLSLWKRGSFGEMKPFWHTGKDKDYKNHLFVYDLNDDTFKQAWCSSNLDRPIVKFEIRDTDGDALNELVVTEGQYKKVFGSKYTQDFKAPQRVTIWEWNEWGFQLKTPFV